MKKLLSLSFMLAALLCSQVPEPQDEFTNPATREDVLELKERISVLQQQAEAAEMAAAERSAEERKKIISEYERNISALKGELSAKLESIEREARERARDDQIRSKRTFWSVLGTGLVLAALAILITWRFRKKPLVVLKDLRSSKPNDTLMDADAGEIESHAKAHNLKHVQIGIRLSEGAVVYATAEVRENKPPLVWFRGKEKPAVWKNRKSAAAELYLSIQKLGGESRLEA